MLRITIYCVGEQGSDYLKVGESEYLKRLKRYCRLEIRIIKPERILLKSNANQIKQKEGERILSHITRDHFTVALDVAGKEFDSNEFADRIADWQNRGTNQIAFIIGGPLGLDDRVVNQSQLVFSLSKLTFTHDLTRLLLLEQLYRAFSIIRGEKYHK